jgi:phosphoribosylformimino-5-aminoimidazole carboxamide ribotide isomerase
MLIPSIDLMGGKIVQLVQGEKKKLEFDNFDYWIERFSKYPMVQLIDLDAARGTGDNRALVTQIVARLHCQVGGRVAIDGWRTNTAITAYGMIRELQPFCETFLYTHIDTEGLMGGIPMDTVLAIRRATTRHLVVAGGITEQQEIETLDALGIDAVVGMALYSGKISS